MKGKNAFEYFGPEIYTPETKFLGDEIFLVNHSAVGNLSRRHDLAVLHRQFPNLLIVGNTLCIQEVQNFLANMPRNFDFIFLQQSNKRLNMRDRIFSIDIWNCLYMLQHFRKQNPTTRVNQFSLGPIGEDVIIQGFAELIDRGKIAEAVHYANCLAVPDPEIQRISRSKKLRESLLKFHRFSAKVHSTSKELTKTFNLLFPKPPDLMYS